jgi:hypothetical protein
MRKEKLPEYIDLLVYAEEFQLLNDRLGRKIKRALRAGIVDQVLLHMLQKRISQHQRQQAFAGPFSLPQRRRGKLVLGLDRQHRPVRCPPQYFNEPSLTVGSTGSGKTTKSRFWILQLARLVTGMWLFDLRKREFGLLKPYLARIGVDLTVLPARQLRQNPMQVPEFCDPRDYAPNLADALVRVLKLPSGAAKLLHQAVLYLYHKFGILDGSKRYPTLFDLRESIIKNKQANAQSRQATIASLDPVLSSLREVLCYHYGWTTGELAKRHLVFELSGIAETDKDLLLNILLLGEFMSRLGRGVSNQNMNLWICCDEAARLVSGTDSSISQYIGLIRGTGIGLDLSIQSAQLAHTILSNTPNKFIGRCACATDYDQIGAAIGLTTEQRRWLPTHLVPGQFVGSLGQGSWRLPFLFQVPRLDF